MAARLRSNRETTQRGGYGMNRQLRTMENTPAVVWINGNSYVCEELPLSGFHFYSINGIGEIRWKVEKWNSEYEQVTNYFLENDNA